MSKAMISPSISDLLPFLASLSSYRSAQLLTIEIRSTVAPVACQDVQVYRPHLGVARAFQAGL
jgi:hypothetical protein